MKTAVYGFDIIGAQYIKQLLITNNLQLTAIGDDDLDTANMLASKFGCPGFNSFNEMLKESKPELICIFAQASEQSRIVMEAVRSGKRVICSVPDVNNENDIKTIVKAVDMGQLYILHPQRNIPHNTDLFNKVKNGSIGKVGVIHFKRYVPFEQKVSGILMDLAINDIDMTVWTIGSVKNVFAVKHSKNGLDYLTITLKFENGAMANIESLYGYPGKEMQMVEIAGNLGVIRYDSRKTAALQIHTHKSEGHYEAQMYNMSCNQTLAGEIIKAVSYLDGKGEQQVSVDETAALLQILLSVKKSILEGKPMNIGGKNNE